VRSAELSGLVDAAADISQLCLTDLAAAAIASLTSIDNLDLGGFSILPGGWADVRGGHAILHIVFREPDAVGFDSADKSSRRFTFVTCNTGDALTFHPLQAVWNGHAAQVTARTSLALSRIPNWRICNPAFLLELLSLQARLA
jgi:hypothetical protein